MLNKHDLEIKLLNVLVLEGYHWIVRAKDGAFLASEKKPYKLIAFGTWYQSEGKQRFLKPACFADADSETVLPSVRWKNEEPTPIEDVLKELKKRSEAMKE